MPPDQPTNRQSKTLPGAATFTDAEMDEAREVAKEIHHRLQHVDDVFGEPEDQIETHTNDKVDDLFIAYGGRPDHEPMDQLTAAVLTLADILARQLP